MTTASPQHIQDLGWWLGGSVLGPMRRFAGAIIITAGPWLVAVVALGVITASMLPVLGRAALEDLNLSVVYAFCLAPLVSGPTGAIAARLVRAAWDEGEGTPAAEVFVLAALAAGLVTQGLALILVLALGIGPVEISVAFVCLSVAAALLWVSFAVLCAYRAYGVLIAAFSAGMVLSVACSLLAARNLPSVEVLIWSFNVGLSLCVALSIGHAVRLSGWSTDRLAEAARALQDEVRRHWQLFLSVSLAIAAVWVDKWFFWFGPEGARSAAGFLHYAPFDSVMFLAQLSIVPTFAALLLFHDDEIERTIARFRRALRHNSTHAVISEEVRLLNSVIWAGFLRIGFVQGVVATALVLMSPLVTEVLGFSFNQLLFLQVGVIAVFLQSLIYLAASVLVLCNQNRLFLLIQASFLVINALASIFFYLILGVSAYAIFTGSLICAVASLLLAYRSLSAFDYGTFVSQNEALYTK